MENATAQFLVLVRHGQSLANVLTARQTDHLFYELAGSDTGVGLTATGMQESIICAQALARLFPRSRPLNHSWLSRYLRVRQTAFAIASELGYSLPSKEDFRLEKRNYGCFWNLTYRGVQILYPDEYERFQREGALSYRPPGGENYLDVFARVESFLREEIELCQGNHLVVTHSVVILSMQRAFGEISDEDVVRMYEQVGIANGGILIYTRSSSREPWRRFDWHADLAA